MTKILIQTIKAEFEYSDITMEELCEKYKCTTKELTGYTTWKKADSYTENIDTSLNLVYDTIAAELDDTLNSKDEEEPLEIEVVDEEEKEHLVEEIKKTAKDIKDNKPVTIGDMDKRVIDGFEGLRKLDKALQAQASTLLLKIDEMLPHCETPKDVKDLVQSHTAIRDTYFNSKSPMVNIINGDVVGGNKNELATLLDGVIDDC